MEHEFWHERWQKNRIGFHEGVPNRLLTAYFPAMGLRPGARVFVPLCGRSVDLLWLREAGMAVVGIDLSPLAVPAYFAAQGLEARQTVIGDVTRHEAAGTTLFCGDIFDLDRLTLGPVDAVYDRAALIALPPAMRQRYAAHLRVITASAPQLLITLDYDQAAHAGPPFSVPEAEVRCLYGDGHHVISLTAQEVAGGLKGRCPATEHVWQVRPVIP